MYCCALLSALEKEWQSYEDTQQQAVMDNCKERQIFLGRRLGRKNKNWDHNPNKRRCDEGFDGRSSRGMGGGG